MNILHVLSQFEVTGAEAYAAALVEEQAKRGHRLFVVSDTITLPMRATCINWPIGRRTYGQRVKNIVWLVEFVRENDIQVVHAHSRAASWVSFFAAWWTRVPYVSTVHGRQHVHASSKAFNIYGHHVVAVCESVQEHLVRELGLPPDEITVIRNGVSMQQKSRKKSPASRRQLFHVSKTTKVILFVGRFSGPKGDVIRFLISDVFPVIRKEVSALLYILGGGSIPEDIASAASRINRALPEHGIIFGGFQPNVRQYMEASDVVIGSGRVAVEALMSRKPLLALGESNYHGLITSENFSAALKTNFGDTGQPARTDPQKTVNDFLYVLKKERTGKERVRLSTLAARHFNARDVASSVQNIYERALIDAASRSSIPTLMYRRVIGTASRHRRME